MASKRGAPARTGRTSEKMLRTRLDEIEWAQIEAFVTKHGRDMSHWVRVGLEKIGALKPRKIK